MAERDVIRDENGEAVVLTPLQVRAVWHAIQTVEAVRREEGYTSLFDKNQSIEANLRKSRLLGRMLIDGRPPLVEKPAFYLGACGYHFVEPDLPHSYLGAVFQAVIVDGVAVPVIPATPEEAW